MTNVEAQTDDFIAARQATPVPRRKADGKSLIAAIAGASFDDSALSRSTFWDKPSERVRQTGPPASRIGELPSAGVRGGDRRLGFAQPVKCGDFGDFQPALSIASGD